MRLIPLAVVVIVALAGCGNPSEEDGPSAVPAEVEQIVERRCYACHSQEPTDPDYKLIDLPKFDDRNNPMRYRERIYEVVVVSKRMPQGNRTNMTQDERDRIAAWAKPG